MTDFYLSESDRMKLESARVGIAGAGGLGSNVAMLLVRLGVRKLTICDFDVVAESNLNRQFFFRDQIGMKKVEALKANLLRIEPELDLRIDDRLLDAEGVKALFADCDILVEAVDEAETKAIFYNAFMGGSRPIVGASGIAGIGRSNAIRVRRLGGNLHLVGDGESGVGGENAPHGPRVAIAASMQANTVAALLLGVFPG